MSSPHFLQTRTLDPSSSFRFPTLEGSAHFEQTIMTLERWTGASFSMIPPCALVPPGRVCRFTMFTFSITTRPRSESTFSTPVDVLVRDGELWVLDWYSAHVRRVDLD